MLICVGAILRERRFRAASPNEGKINYFSLFHDRGMLPVLIPVPMGINV